MATLLQVSDIHVYYGSIHAIKGVSFEVNEGEIVTLIGANGAGKSTTLNTVAGLLKPRSGAIAFDGKNIVGIGASKVVGLGMALCPEGRRVFQQMTVRENLEMGGFSRPAEEIPGSLENVFGRFPRLKEREKQVAGTLSGGEQQMLAMGRAMMSKPKLLMLDEPSMGLARCWWNRSSASSRSCTRRAPPSSWWSRTRRWPCPSPTAPTCWAPATSPYREAPRRCWRTTACARRTWAADPDGILSHGPTGQPAGLSFCHGRHERGRSRGDRASSRAAKALELWRDMDLFLEELIHNRLTNPRRWGINKL